MLTCDADVQSGPLEAASSLLSRKERMKSALQELRGYKVRSSVQWCMWVWTFNGITRR
jgi:energy-converting hydrogenase Eha subunit G